MFKNKGVKPTKKKVVVEPKVSSPYGGCKYGHHQEQGLKKNCLKIESQSRRRSLLLIRKRSKDYNNLLSRLFRRCKQRTHHKI